MKRCMSAAVLASVASTRLAAAVTYNCLPTRECSRRPTLRSQVLCGEPLRIEGGCAEMRADQICTSPCPTRTPISPGVSFT